MVLDSCICCQASAAAVVLKLLYLKTWFRSSIFLNKLYVMLSRFPQNTVCGIGSGSYMSYVVPNKLVDALQACDQTSFPNILALFQLSLTIPITSCECERSFSQLKLMETYCHYTITD